VDPFGRRVPARYVVDITAAMPAKEAMLSAHESQRSWLRAQHGEDEYLDWMRRMGADRAKDLGRRKVRWAEGFRPHLGHGFPRADLLTPALGKGIVTTLDA
jgi:LmbE family N-acetylglucosaminyl deacetylase